MKIKLTMKQIADEMGLSRMTVSSIINGRARELGYASKTVERVEKYLDERGYVPSRYARHTRAGPSRLVGVLQCTDAPNDHLTEAFHQLAREFTCIGLGPEIMVTSRERLKTAVRELLARRVTDLVWIHDCSYIEDYRNEEIASYLSNTRVIVYNYMFEAWSNGEDLVKRGFAMVGIDRLTHTRRLARFLRKLGHKSIALLDNPASKIARHDAFESVGFKVIDYPPPFHAERMIEAMTRHGVTCAHFHGDSSACQAICALRNLGIRIPEDLTVTGFDGMSRDYNPDLTTLAIPIEKMVERVCEIAKGSVTGQRHCFDLKLVKGRTHAPPRSPEQFEHEQAVKKKISARSTGHPRKSPSRTHRGS